MESKQYVTQLVYAAKNSNNSSFEELYNIYYEKIYALCLTTLKNSADAEEALQLTFINAWQKIDELKDNSSFNTWIQRIRKVVLHPKRHRICLKSKAAEIRSAAKKNTEV